MITILNHTTKAIACFMLMFGISAISASGQKAEAETEFKYLKNSDNSRTLTYTVKSKKGEGDPAPVPGTAVVFSCGGNDLATVKTNADGVAKYTAPASQSLLYEADGKLKFTAAIAENPAIEAKSDELSLTDIELEFEFKTEDSIRKVYMKASELWPNGEKKPVAKADIVFYIPRMFSLLKIAEGSLGEDGTGEIEFPSGIAGDSLGILTVVGRIEEHENYANVEKSQAIAWGKPVDYHIPKFQRALWTAVAPSWMIITLTILLIGVWAHYAFVIYKLWKIKQESRKLQ